MRRILTSTNTEDAPYGKMASYGMLIVTLGVLSLTYLALGIAGVLLVGAAIWSTYRIVAQKRAIAPSPGVDMATGLMQREGVVTALDKALLRSTLASTTTAAIVLEISDFRLTEERFDRAGVEELLATIGDRMTEVLRDSDTIGRVDGPVFAIALSSSRRLDLEAAIQLCTRLQQAVARPIPIGPNNLYVTASVGFCLASRLEEPSGERLLQAATTAMIEAERSGPGAIRGYSEAMRARIVSRNSLSAQVSKALENGELTAFYQPQVNSQTGELTGFETLARWQHPERGMIPPIEFLPALAQAGLMERLGQEMVRQGLDALRHWHGLGLTVPRVAVNFSTEELRNPGLVDWIAQELDRHDLPASCLAIEVLETVVAGRTEDQVIRNLAGLAKLGCALDLDDFGTGHASITNIRRFSIARIKIDRSFVTRIDEDPDQQMMFAAILTMAERLGLDTLAEGVETEAELQMLKDLGCEHVQGYGVARPMPREDADTWLQERAESTVTSFDRKVS